MASASEHLRQWKHNRELLSSLPPSHPDWIVTVVFYTALQAVDALLAFDKVLGITTHERPNEVLLRTNRYSKINRGHYPLYMLSRTVRYMANPAAWVKVEEMNKRVLPHLYHVEQSVAHLMGASFAGDFALSPVVLKTA
jgi:hypothetical protein